MHWDPGPFWNWNHFLNLLGDYVVPTGSAHSPVVTINPNFATNLQAVTDCENHTPVADQASNFVYLRTAPNASAPLFNDPGFNPAGTVGTTCAAGLGRQGQQRPAVRGRGPVRRLDRDLVGRRQGLVREPERQAGGHALIGAGRRAEAGGDLGTGVR